MARILAVEPDPERSVILQRLVKESLDVDLILTVSAADAITNLYEAQPDLILLSSLLPPDEDEHLTAHLRLAPHLDHLPVLTIPPLVEQGKESEEQVGLLRRFLLRFRRRPRTWRTYDFSAVARRIEEALEESRLNAQDYEFERPARLLLLEAKTPMLLTAASGADIESEALSLVSLEAELRSYAGHRELQARAPRLEWHQLPWLNTVKLTWGAELRLVNISRSGLLVESGVRFTMGNRTEFQLVGSDQEVIVKARVVRSDVCSVNSLGVKYVAAAAFDEPFEILDMQSSKREARHAFGPPDAQELERQSRLHQHADDIRARDDEGLVCLEIADEHRRIPGRDHRGQQFHGC